MTHSFDRLRSLGSRRKERAWHGSGATDRIDRPARTASAPAADGEGRA